LDYELKQPILQPTSSQGDVKAKTNSLMGHRPITGLAGSKLMNPLNFKKPVQQTVLLMNFKK